MPMTLHRRLQAALSSLQGKYSILLVIFLVFFLVSPIADMFFPTELSGGMLFDLLSIFLLLAALYAVSGTHILLILVGLLAAPAIGGRFALYFAKNSALLDLSDGFNFLALAVVAIIILRQVLQAEQVSSDVVQGAVCVYILVGLAWAYLFSFIESVRPGSFHLPPLSTASMSSFVTEGRQHFPYYSFVTLTTVGYGDITPVAPLVQRLAVLEAMFGQLYMSVLVARLVGLHVAHSNRREEDFFR